MLRVEETLKISIPREGLGMNRLEEILLQELRRFGKELRETVVASLEELALNDRQGKVIRKRGGGEKGEALRGRRCPSLGIL